MKRPRPRKRTLLIPRMLLLLTGGAIINVAVAWGCAMWVPRSRQVDYRPLLYQKQHWIETLAADERGKLFKVHNVRGFAALGVGVHDEVLLCFVTPTQILLHEPTPIHYGTESIVRSGWPRECLSGSALSQRSRGLAKPKLTSVSALLLPGSIVYPNGYTNVKRLPLRPLWPGFAINTIFYAAILWLLFAAPGKIRRTIRGRRGQCPACGYPIGASHVCTECGRPLR